MKALFDDDPHGFRVLDRTARRDDALAALLLIVPWQQRSRLHTTGGERHSVLPEAILLWTLREVDPKLRLTSGNSLLPECDRVRISASNLKLAEDRRYNPKLSLRRRLLHRAAPPELLFVFSHCLLPQFGSLSRSALFLRKVEHLPREP